MAASKTRACEDCGSEIERDGDRGRRARKCSLCRRRRDEPIVDRTSTSPAILAERVRAVGEAWRAGDENATREELRKLADEANLAAAMSPLLPTGFDRRVRIAVERGPTGRAA